MVAIGLKNMPERPAASKITPASAIENFALILVITVASYRVLSGSVWPASWGVCIVQGSARPSSLALERRRHAGAARPLRN